MKLALLLVTMFMIFAFNGSHIANTAEITGTVIDSQTQTPLVGAALRIQNTDIGIITDVNGTFLLIPPTPGHVTIVITYIGYTDVSQEVTVREDETLSVIFSLEPDPFIAETVVVTASKNKRLAIETVETINVITTEKLENTNATTITNALRDVPGVSMNMGPNPDRERPEIRGMGGERVLLSVDGAKMNLSTMNIGDTHVTADNIERIEIVKGPSSALYGSSAMGGVINIITKEPRALLRDGKSIGSRLKYTYNDLNACSTEHLQLYGILGDSFDWKTSFSRRDGKYLTLDSENAQNLKQGENTTGDNLQLNGIYHVNSRNKVKVQYERFFYNPITESGYIAEPDDGTYYNYQEREYRRDLHQISYSLSGARTFLSSLEIRGYRQLTDVTDDDDERTDIEGFPPIREIVIEQDTNKLTTYGAEIKATSMVLTKGDMSHEMTYGLELMQDSFHQTTKGTTSTYDSKSEGGFSDEASQVESTTEARSPDTDYAVYSAYIQDEIAWGEHIILIPGLRFDSYNAEADKHTDGYDVTLIEDSSSHETAVSPKFGIVGKLSDQQSLTLNIGKGFRVPSKGELYYAFNMANIFFIIPNPELKPESCINYEFSHKMQTRHMYGSTGIFLTRYDDFIGGRYLDPAPGETLKRYQYINKDRVDMWGIESSYTVNFPKQISASTGVTYHRGKYKDSGDRLEGLHKPKITLSMQYSPAVKDAAMHFTASGRYVGPVDYYETVEDTTGEEIDVLDEYGGYTVLDIGAGITYKNKYRLNLYINNVLDKQYQEFSNLLLPSPGRYFSVSVSAAY